MSKIYTKEEIKLFSNCTYEGNMYINFSVEEMQQYLINLGYKIILYSNVASVRDSIHEGGEINYIGNHYDAKFTTLIAIKAEQEAELLTLRLDDEKIRNVNITHVFKEELKKSLLRLSNGII
ncbi:MAG: hypothetical protein HC836_31650 [Richelia sp. RM2_1_2]|nr:hypothetical protein [Richelia sp. RM2_1_2]